MISAPGPNALGYNGLTERRDGLPAHTYYDPGHFALELQRIWHRNWLYAGRSAELARPGDYRTFEFGYQRALLGRDADG